MLSFVGLVIVLIGAGAALALVPMDSRIKTTLVVVVVVGAVVSMLLMFGVLTPADLRIR